MKYWSPIKGMEVSLGQRDKSLGQDNRSLEWEDWGPDAGALDDKDHP